MKTITLIAVVLLASCSHHPFCDSPYIEPLEWQCRD